MEKGRGKAVAHRPSIVNGITREALRVKIPARDDIYLNYPKFNQWEDKVNFTL